MAEVTCIYKIVNTINGKIYVGSAVNFRKRKNLHLKNLRDRKHGNKHLQLSFNKYGLDNFVFEIIELCSREILLEREQYYIDTLKPDYNICKSVERSRLGLKNSPEHIAKIRNANLGSKRSLEACKNIGLAKLGKKASPETIAKLKLRPRTEETKRKIGNFRLGKIHTEKAKENMRNAIALRNYNKIKDISFNFIRL